MIYFKHGIDHPISVTTLYYWPWPIWTSAGGIHSVAESLLVFLASLREPVIPYKFYQKCLDGANNFVLCKQVRKLMYKYKRLLAITSLRPILPEMKASQIAEQSKGLHLSIIARWFLSLSTVVQTFFPLWLYMQLYLILHTCSVRWLIIQTDFQMTKTSMISFDNSN